MAISKEDKKRLDKIRGRDPRRGSSSSRRVRRGKEIKRDRERRLQEARKKEAREDRERTRQANLKKAAPKPVKKVVKPPEPEKKLSLVEKIKAGFGRAEEQAGGKLPGPFDIMTTVGVGGVGVGLSRLVLKTDQGFIKTGKLVQTTITGGPAFQVNTKTAGLTRTMLGKIVAGVGKFVKNPVVITTALIGAIGSYPFAGFIKEEALQTLGLGVGAAIRNDDVEGAEAALELQKEILDPDLWEQIKAKIPYVNILSELDDFYDAARTKLVIDDKIVSDLKTQQETGETDDAKWERVRQEQAAQDKAAIDYYNEQRKLQLKWEEEAKDRDMKEDAAFWAAEAAKQRKLEEEDRKAIADFWTAYRKRTQEFAENNRPSNLNFGLL